MVARLTSSRDNSPSTRASSTIAAWRQWRDEDERQARALGAELRAVVERERWPELTVAERGYCVEAARRQLHKRLGLVRETLLEWNDSDDPGLSYDEKTGAVHLPRHHLNADYPLALVGGLAEELRHAWQFDVIEDRLEHPLGRIGKERLAAAYAGYNAADPAAYSASELEMDAKDFAADVAAGFGGDV